MSDGAQRPAATQGLATRAETVVVQATPYKAICEMMDLNKLQTEPVRTLLTSQVYMLPPDRAPWPKECVCDLVSVLSFTSSNGTKPVNSSRDSDSILVETQRPPA